MNTIGALILVAFVLVSVSIWGMWYAVHGQFKPRDNEWIDGTKKGDDE